MLSGGNKKKKKKKGKGSEKKASTLGFEVEVEKAFGVRAGTLSDWLNPNHKHFWKELKSNWKSIAKAKRKILVKNDRKRVDLKNRVEDFPYPTETDDHCETAPEAYKDIAPILTALAQKLGKKNCELKIYDP